MNIEELLATKTCVISFRAPILIAAKIERAAREANSNASRLTVELWQREIERSEKTAAGVSNESSG